MQLIELCDVYQQAHTEYLTVLMEEADVDSKTTRFEGKQAPILDFHRQVQSWIQQSEQLLTEKLESVSRHIYHTFIFLFITILK